MTQACKFFAKLTAIATMLLCAAAYAQAHKVNVFAALDGNVIVGKVYFSGGGVAENIDVDVFSQDNLKVATVKTSAKGEFFFVPKAKDTQYMFSVDTGDGHAAKTTVAIGANLATPAVAPAAPGAKPRPPAMNQLQARSPDALASSAPQQFAIDPDIIAGVVAAELSKQLRPLHEKIDAYESKVRFSDILGGLGCLFGAAGLLAFLWARLKLAKGQEKPKSPEKN
jgi:nickel transport protein